MKTNIKDLKKTGQFRLAYPRTLREAVLSAAKSWEAFTKLSPKIKQSLPYSNGGAGVGYELKNGAVISADHKENFDITIQGYQWLIDNYKNISNSKALRFIEDSTALVYLIKPIAMDFARRVEAEFGLEGFAKEVEESESRYFIRFIHYFSDCPPGTETAQAHVDQSGFTLHLFESDLGLQYLPYIKRKWADMPVSKGDTVIIPAMQMQLRSKGELRALAHRVVSTEKTAKTGRYSAVCFIQLKNTPKYDKDRCGRLQEKEPGFNYSMPHQEFATMFK